MVEVDKRLLGPEARRPLSPHLQIYTPMLTMMMSIAHRITGVALYGGTILLAWYLIALAAGPSSFSRVSAVYGSYIGLAFLVLFTWSMLHHLLGGVRHLFWDMGYGLDYPGREYLARATLVGGFLLTVLVWGAAYAFA